VAPRQPRPAEPRWSVVPRAERDHAASLVRRSACYGVGSLLSPACRCRPRDGLCVEVPHPAVMSCKLLIVANLAKLRPVIRRTTSGTSNCRANGLRTNRSSAPGPRRGTPNAPAPARNARGQQPMTLVAWPLRRYRPLPTLLPPPKRASTALSPASPPVRGDPCAPVPAGEGSLSRTDLVAAPSTAASCVTGTLWPAVGCGGGSLLVQRVGLPGCLRVR
jgi:hypothetical protein